MGIHPKARPVFSKLSLPGPVEKHFSGVVCDIDLSNNTNPHLGNWGQYPDLGQEALKELYLKTVLSLITPKGFENKQVLTPENALFTVGSMEGLDLILRTFSEPNKGVICTTVPSFPAYTHWALIHNLTVKTVPLLGDNLDQVSVGDIVDINPDILFLCNPNNPTGTKLDNGLIQNLCESLEGFVVVDEAYVEFSEQPSLIYALNKHKNLIITRTLSKSWGLAAARCGVVLADKLVINSLRYVQTPFGFSTPSQEMIKERLMNPQEVFGSWQRIRKNRDDLVAQLSKHSAISKVFKSDANFIMCVLNDFEKVMALLNANKIYVMDCNTCWPNAIRVSIGTEEENAAFLKVISQSSREIR